ncbi:uncharacterized protein SCHCODRAFT_02684533 [Schizophyllum commune H4-8]|uniref:Expressed protein n=1 Tax=Schizophyllum commune (strain H4-8 / FGSC 9210) TaxID=578458 RepID=D8PPT3_SCHCM|nr:uncharacterized protein SCHCODRAFT_02684533 [Schizophyllum commune H4-8]KAI5898314.1 hypothetical protein SCHCODRAFT_02684533 [Schizophyllum commune H4-8]
MYELVRTEGFGQSEAGEEKLTDTEHRALVRAREKLTFAWVMNSGIMAPKVPRPSDGRHGYLNCVESTRLGDSKYCEVIREAKIIEQYMNDAICGFKALIDIDWEKHGFCQKCADDRRSAWRELREKEWLNLDEYLSELS